MFCHEVYALINNEKVKELALVNSYEMANILARKRYGDDSIAIFCSYWRCYVGDIYRDGKFYDEKGNERQYEGSEIENINQLKTENNGLKQEATDNLEQLLDTQFELEKTKDEVVDNYEQLLDLQFEVEQLKDNIEK